MTDVALTILRSPEFAAFVVASLATIAGFVAKSVIALLNRKLTAEQLRVLFTIATRAVQVAEQTGFDKTAAEKLDIATETAQTFIDAYGMKVSAAQLRAAIEAAVFAELAEFPVVVEPPAA